MNNEETRSRVMEILGFGPLKFYEILAIFRREDRQFDDRALDRNLQALRKKGTIGFDSKKGWGLR